MRCVARGRPAKSVRASVSKETQYRGQRDLLEGSTCDQCAGFSSGEPFCSVRTMMRSTISAFLSLSAFSPNCARSLRSSATCKADPHPVKGWAEQWINVCECVCVFVCVCVCGWLAKTHQCYGCRRGQATRHALHLEALEAGLHLLHAQGRAAACHLQRDCPRLPPPTNDRRPATWRPPIHRLQRVQGCTGTGAGTRREGGGHRP